MGKSDMAAPETASAVPTSPEDAVKIELKKATTDTSADLQKLKDQLKSDHSITNENDPTIKAEMEELTKFFEGKKNEIKFITKGELKQLAEAMKDTAASGQGEKLEGALDVNADGGLVFNETKTESATATPETPKAPEVSLTAIEGIKIPEAAQEAMAKYNPNAKTNWIDTFFTDLKNKFWDFLAGFGMAEQVAQWRGFANSALEKKAEISYTMLTGDEGRSILDKSPLSNILILDHVNKNEFKKILAQYPTLDFSNKTNIEAAFLGKYADKPELAKYHRIYEGMREMCGELSSTEGVAYNPEERLKRLLNYSRKEEMDEMVDANQPGALPVVAPIVSATPVENGSATPEVQNQDRKEAEEAEAELEKAKSMTAVSDSEKALQAEAIKKATENINVIKDREKGIILSALKETDDKLADSTRKKETLEAGDAVKNKSEIAKLVKEVDLYTKSQKDIKVKIDAVMVTTDASRDKWTFKDTANTDMIILARIGIQGILGGTLDVSSKRETGEVDKTETETIAEEVEKLSKKIEKSAVDYIASTTPDRKTMLKKEAQETLETIKKKEKEAIDKNKEIQARRGENKDDTLLEAEANKSEEAIGQIQKISEKAQNVMNKIETNGASELPPLDPTDSNNIIYIPSLPSNQQYGNMKVGKFYQYDNFGLLPRRTYIEVGFEESNLAIRGNNFGQQNRESSALPPTAKIIPYSEANMIMRKLDTQQKGLQGEEITIPPQEAEKYFAGKFHNIKTK